MEKKKLEIKLAELNQKLKYLEEVESLRIKNLMIESDMGDDFRENEAAKLAMEEHRMWTVRKQMLRAEIVGIRTVLLKKDH